MVDSSNTDPASSEKAEGSIDEDVRGTGNTRNHDQDGLSEEDAHKVALRAK